MDGAFATLVSDDAVRAIDAAFRLYLLPQGVFSVAIATVLFPTISRLAARDDIGGHARAPWPTALRQIFFMLLPASAFLLVLAEPVVRLRLPARRVRRDQHGAHLRRRWSIFAIGLAFNGASLLVIRAFFSLQMPWWPPRSRRSGVVLNVALDAVFYKPLGTGGIPLVDLDLEHRDLRGAACGCWSASWAACTAPGCSTASLRSLLASGDLGGLRLGRLAGRSTMRSGGASRPSSLSMTARGRAPRRSGYLAAAQAFEMPELRALSRLRRPLR